MHLHVAKIVSTGSNHRKPSSMILQQIEYIHLGMVRFFAYGCIFHNSITKGHNRLKAVPFIIIFFTILAWLILPDKEGPQCISALSMVGSVTNVDYKIISIEE